MGKIRYGISNVYVAVLTEANDGTISYGTPFALPGAVSLSIDPESGESTPFYADNIVWYKTPEVNNGYTGELELAVVPQKFLTDVLGMYADAGDSGTIFEAATFNPKRFALLFQAEGDTYNTRYCFYDCMASRPSRENNTKEDSIEPGTDTISLTMSPRSSDQLVKAICDGEISTSMYNTWFSAVPEPNPVV